MAPVGKKAAQAPPPPYDGSLRSRPVRWDWSGIGDRGHAVQFYTDNEALLDLLSRYVGTALVTGDAAVVIATKIHRDGLDRCLRGRGLDVEVARREQRYVALDAAQTLSSCLRNGWPDAELFEKTIAGAIDRAAAAVGGAGCRVAAFGEMAALLWEARQPDAAVQLEELWNSLTKTRAFSLCCAYPMRAFGSQSAAAFMKICAQHSHVFPVERRGKTRLPQLA